MDVLCCKSPEMIRKEMWVHVLAYNLLRSIMCSVADEYDVTVRQLSFKGILQLINAFRHSIHTATSEEELNTICDAMFKAGLTHKVGNRPDRYEPRKRKRHPKPYPYMKKTRNEERKALIQ